MRHPVHGRGTGRRSPLVLLRGLNLTEVTEVGHGPSDHRAQTPQSRSGSRAGVLPAAAARFREKWQLQEPPACVCECPPSGMSLSQRKRLPQKVALRSLGSSVGSDIQ